MSTLHKYKSGSKQCFCQWCGKPRIIAMDECPVNDDIREAISMFARNNGRNWLSKLRDLWMTGNDDGLLRQARNTIGPTRIAKVPIDLAPGESDEDRAEHEARVRLMKGGAN